MMAAERHNTIGRFFSLGCKCFCSSFLARLLVFDPFKAGGFDAIPVVFALFVIADEVKAVAELSAGLFEAIALLGLGIIPATGIFLCMDRRLTYQ